MECQGWPWRSIIGPREGIPSKPLHHSSSSLCLGSLSDDTFITSSVSGLLLGDFLLTGAGIYLLAIYNTDLCSEPRTLPRNLIPLSHNSLATFNQERLITLPEILD